MGEGCHSIDGLRAASSGRSNDGRTVAADEADVENLTRNRRAKPSGEMQRCAFAYRRLHGIGKRGIIAPASARLCEADPGLAYNSAVPREARANGDLMVIVLRVPAGRDPRRDALNAGHYRLPPFSGLRRRSFRPSGTPIKAELRSKRPFPKRTATTMIAVGGS
jgi:hypothetical protein